MNNIMTTEELLGIVGLTQFDKGKKILCAEEVEKLRLLALLALQERVRLTLLALRQGTAE